MANEREELVELLLEHQELIPVFEGFMREFEKEKQAILRYYNKFSLSEEDEFKLYESVSKRWFRQYGLKTE